MNLFHVDIFNVDTEVLCSIRIIVLATLFQPALIQYLTIPTHYQVWLSHTLLHTNHAHEFISIHYTAQDKFDFISAATVPMNRRRSFMTTLVLF